MQPDMPTGIIGLGLMGTALTERLIAAKMPVIGFDIDPARCERLKTNGVVIAASVRELASRSRTIVIAVYTPTQIETFFGDIAEAAGDRRPTVICTTTCAPDEILRLAQRASRAGIAFVEAPISGNSSEVRDGAAMVLVAGDPDAIDAISALLDILCPHRLNAGKIGDASRTKLAINLILQNNRAALAEGIVFAERLGLDGQAFLAAARQSGGYSRVMDVKGEKMLTRDFHPHSHIVQTLKDAELILAEAARCGLHLPVTTLQAQLLRAAIAIEGRESDASAIIEAIRQQPAPEISE
jgi:3-hydroxyisobutyrate dehydrogenase-like beta-hydroxyacid dehydrogenase